MCYMTYHIDREQKRSSVPTSARKLISFATTCYILTDHFQEIKRWCFKTHFHSSYFSMKTNGKRILWHWPVLMHSIIKGLFCIDELLCENKRKGRWHSANSGSFFKPTLLLCIIHSLWWQQKPLFSAGNLEQKQRSWIKYSTRLVPVACWWRQDCAFTVIWKHTSLKDVAVGCLFVSTMNSAFVTES